MNWQRVKAYQLVSVGTIIVACLAFLLMEVGTIDNLFGEDYPIIYPNPANDISFSTTNNNFNNSQAEGSQVSEGLYSPQNSSDATTSNSINYYPRKNVDLSPGSLPGKNAPPQAAGLVPATDPLLSQQLSESMLNIAPDRETRALIERARRTELDAQRGVDTTAEKWQTVKDGRITWGGRIFGDWVNWMNDTQLDGQRNYVEFRQLRLFAAGEGYGVYDFKLEFEFAPENEVDADVVDQHVQTNAFGLQVKDAYVGIKDLPYLGYMRIGHFKAPFGLEELTSAEDQTFMERALPNIFTPHRQLGMAAYNQTENQNLSLSYGVFFYDFDESIRVMEDDNQGMRATSRLVWTPYYDEPSEGRYLLHSGIGYSYARPQLVDDPNNPGISTRKVQFRSRPEIDRGSFLIDTGELDVQQYNTLDTELAWVHGQLSIQSELMWTGMKEASGQDKDMYGAYVYMSYFLTGEHRRYDRRFGSFDRVIPLENFWLVRTPDGTRGGRGAWEAAVRWSFLDFTDVNSQQLQDVTTGLNWYWNPNTRMMFNWIHTFTNNSPVDPGGYAQGDVFGMRMQVDF